ncbi:hypothetical protein SAMN05880501_101261 [Ureibacillus xyleni]|uniref:DUF8042 domain-containing protein n=1 Tax=Ureibacillus xyleni TaxID=614648 RepID=A0A285RAF9_9BACL|nr:hypothetical protein [Ureibacillus xyleni]SOB91096.1 hypothetical protein SAMN05880501_101261 [Ureibacillus xyleni]
MSEIILEVIESYNQYLDKVVNGSTTIADLLRTERISDAMNIILDFTEGMGWLTDVSILLKQNDVSINLRVEQIHEFLIEINTGLINQDYVLVADMFEYEIAPFFESVEPINTVSD